MISREPMPPGEIYEVMVATEPLCDALRETGDRASHHLARVFAAMLRNFDAKDRGEILEEFFACMKGSLH